MEEEEDPAVERARTRQAVIVVILVPHIIGLLALAVHGVMVWMR